jgi:AraC-like DNA-binding protein
MFIDQLAAVVAKRWQQHVAQFDTDASLSTRLGLQFAFPSPPLQDYVSYYWLSLNNTEPTYSIVPDGAVDVVFMFGQEDRQLHAYGSTTSKADLSITIAAHYLGIRFKPGQSRHFIDVSPVELTNTAISGDDQLFIAKASPVALDAANTVFYFLDQLLLQHLRRRPLLPSGIDKVVEHIQLTHGMLRVDQLASLYGKSRRQFDRLFLNTVGMPPKLYSEIVRFQRACMLVAGTSLSLSQIAADLGYTDQSHLTHQFVRFYGESPSYARKHGSFLQDSFLLPKDN